MELAVANDSIMVTIYQLIKAVHGAREGKIVDANGKPAAFEGDALRDCFLALIPTFQKCLPNPSLFPQ